MEIKPIAWLIGAAGERSFVDDLRQGRTGAPVRVLLTLAAAALALSPGLFVCGLIETTGGRAEDHHIGMAIAAAAILWGVALIFVWWGYRRFRQVIRSVVGIVTVWAVVLPATVAVDSAFPRAEFLIASMIHASVRALTDGEPIEVLAPRAPELASEVPVEPARAP